MIEIKTKSELDELLTSNQLVIIDFTATWCGPCKRFGPVLEKYEGKHEDIKFIKVDVDVASEIVQIYEIRSMPTIIGIKVGVEIQRFSGANESALVNMIDFLKK